MKMNTKIKNQKVRENHIENIEKRDSLIIKNIEKLTKNLLVKMVKNGERKTKNIVMNMIKIIIKLTKKKESNTKNYIKKIFPNIIKIEIQDYVQTL